MEQAGRQAGKEAREYREWTRMKGNNKEREIDEGACLGIGRTRCERGANEVRTRCEQTANKVRTKCEQSANGAEQG